jgi:hypothetical protein
LYVKYLLTKKSIEGFHAINTALETVYYWEQSIEGFFGKEKVKCNIFDEVNMK